MDSNALSAIGTAASALVALAALAVSLFGVGQAVRQNEAHTLLEIVERNEHFARQLLAAKSDRERELEFLNLLSFMESLSFLYNRGLFTHGLIRPMRQIIETFVAGMQARYDFDRALAMYAVGPDQYAEIRAFAARHARSLARKRDRLRDSVFAERWAEDDRAAEGSQDDFKAE